MLSSLVRIGASVLGVALLATLIPFLNADAWQLIAGMSWTRMAAVALLVYVWPMVGLMYTQRRTIKDLLREGFGPENEPLDLETLLNSYRKARDPDPIDPHMEVLIRDSYSNLENIGELQAISRWKMRVTIKNIVKLLFLFLTLPLMVAVFCALFFYFMVDSRVLIEWTNAYIPSEATAFAPFSLSAPTMLTIKASLLFGLVGSTLTLGAQISSKDNLRQLAKENFIDDMEVDRHLLILDDIRWHGLLDGIQAQYYTVSDTDGESPHSEAHHLAVEKGEESVSREDSARTMRERRISTPKIDERGKRLLAKDTEDRPTATLAQRRELLHKVCGVKVSESTISRTLKNLGYTWSRHGWVREE